MNSNWVRREELARHLLVSPNTISSWKLRYEDFPQQIGRYYNLAACKEWKVQTFSKQIEVHNGQFRIPPAHQFSALSGREELSG